MSEPDPHLSKWALERREERQATSSYEVYAVGARPEGPMDGAGGIAVRSSDNAVGQRELEFDVRPVMLGQVEVCVRLTTQGRGAARPHAKRAYLYTSPTALRELARQLLETADAADKLKLKPRPVP
jgi:hypothetical protein